MYGDRPRARASDPETSHAAASSIEQPKLRARQQAILAVLRGAPTGGLTDHELAKAYARWQELSPQLPTATPIPEQSPSGLRTRRAELTAMGLVHDTGDRRPLPSGRSAIVWAARGNYHPTKETTTP